MILKLVPGISFVAARERTWAKATAAFSYTLLFQVNGALREEQQLNFLMILPQSHEFKPFLFIFSRRLLISLQYVAYVSTFHLSILILATQLD